QASSVAAVMALAGCVRAVGYVPGALMSVSIRNGKLLLVSLISVISGLVLIALAIPYGIVWCAIAVLVRHLGVLAWMAAILRKEARRPVAALVGSFALPMVLMLAGATVGRVLPDQPAHELLMIAASVVACALVGAIYFAIWFRAQLSGYCAVLRARLATVP